MVEIEMTTRVPLILGTANIGVAGRTAVSVSTTEAAQELINVFSEKYSELDSARIYGDGTAEEVPFSSHPKPCLIHAANLKSSSCPSWI